MRKVPGAARAIGAELSGGNDEFDAHTKPHDRLEEGSTE